MDLDSRLDIETPENVVFGYEVAGLGSRFLATLIDTTLLIIILSIASAFFGSAAGLAGNAAIALLTLVNFVILWGYYIWFEARWNGQTPGRRALKIRIVRNDGSPMRLSENITRNLLRIVDFMPLFYAVGMVSMLINKQSRRLGDLAAGTVAVRDEDTVTLANVTSEDYRIVTRTAVPQEILDLPVSRLKAADIHVMKDYIRRREEIVNREMISERIVAQLLDTMQVDRSLFGDRAADNLLLHTALRHDVWRDEKDNPKPAASAVDVSSLLATAPPSSAGLGSIPVVTKPTNLPISSAPTFVSYGGNRNANQDQERPADLNPSGELTQDQDSE